MYALVGLFTVVFSVGGAWAMVRSGIKENGRRIVSLEQTRGHVYERLNEQGERIAGMDSMMQMINQNVQTLVKRKES